MGPVLQTPGGHATEAASPRVMERRLADYPSARQALPDDALVTERYVVRFARGAADLDAVLRLRFEVFNVELGEGLASSMRTGRDEDPFDAGCHHLVVAERATGAVVGTYRMQTRAMAAAQGYYTATLFRVAQMPEAVLDAAVELGRACIAPAHRNGRVLFLLWYGLGRYLMHNGLRYLFGCTSLTSQDPALGQATFDHLAAGGHVHPTLWVAPRAGCECLVPVAGADARPTVEIPRLMRIYLEHGARVCGPPAIDRAFKTIDFLTVIDTHDLDDRTRRKLLG